MIGKIISHYKILEELDHGGMGVVYKAEDTKLKRTVALKFLPPQWTRDSAAKTRFIHEAQAASALDHNNVCTVYEIDETDDGQLFIAMAYYDGETLKQKIEQGPLKIDEAIGIAMQVGRGLDKAHQKEIVHRDIKPANVMITDDGVVKVLDFGLAKLVGQTLLTKEGMTLGTMAYMSPEQTEGAAVNHQTDIWALGVLLYETLTGRQPFQGDYDQAVVYSIVNEEAEPITGLRTGVPMELERIVNKCLKKERSERYQHVDELLTDLSSLRKELESTGQQPMSKDARAGSLLKRKPVLIGALAGLAVLAALGLLFLVPSKSLSVNDKSIAVLPFENLNDKTDKYFTDGITEDVLTQLSKIADLRVLSRFTIKQYEISGKSPREIGAELNVANLLTGSIRRSGDRLRIGCQLIDMQSEAQIWAETYDRELQDVFAIQSEVAQHIARTLKAELSVAEKQRIETQPTANLNAYDYYLKGREYYNRYKKEDNENAIELFERALGLDADYALALAGLGDAYGQRNFRFGFASSWVDSAIKVSKKAIALEPNSAEAFKALGVAYAYKGWYDKAIKATRKAAERNPNYFPAVANIGRFYFWTGAFDEALPWQKKAVALNPTFAFAYTIIGDTYRKLEDAVKAEQWLSKALELQQDDTWANYYLALLYVAQERDQEAMQQIERLLSTDPDDYRNLEFAGRIAGYTRNFDQAKQYYQRSIAGNTSFNTDAVGLSGIGLGYLFWKGGQREEAQKLFNLSYKLRQNEVEQGSERSDIAYEISAIHAIQGDKAMAYFWLQKAIDAGGPLYHLALRDRWLENLHNEARFQQIMTEMESKVDSLRQRVLDGMVTF